MHRVLAALVAVAALLPASASAQVRGDGAARIPIAGLGGSLQNPCFSPDSTRIALTRWPRRYNEGAASVHVADLQTGAVLARLTPVA